MKKYIQAYMNEINNFINNELSSADAERIYEVLEEFARSRSPTSSMKDLFI